MVNFTDAGHGITVDLKNGYSILALYKFYDKGRWRVTCYIKDNTVDMWDLIEAMEDTTVCFNDDEGIGKTIADWIIQKNNDGYFTKYIERYKYQLECFDWGNIFSQATSN